VYEHQRAARFQQIDANLEARVAALSRMVRDYYPDAPRAAQHEPSEGHGPERGGGSPPPPGPRDVGGPPEDYRHGHHPPPEGPPHFSRGGPHQNRPKLPIPGTLTELPLSSEAASLLGQLPGAYYFMVWYRDGTVLKRSNNAPAGVVPPLRSERDTLPHFRTIRRFREVLHCSGLGECSLVGQSTQADSEAMRKFGWTLIVAAGAVLALGLGVGWWIAARAIRPIEQISAAANRISRGNLSERIHVAGQDDELNRLATILNSTFSMLQSAFVQQQQFTADVAHELRTPVAVIISGAQTALARERKAAEYRETVKADLDTAQQMRRLTESLLELAQCEEVNEPVPRCDLDLAERARVCIERIRPLAERHGIRIHSELAPASMIGNPDRLDKLILNLLTNAIYYNKPKGEVSISTFLDASGAVLTIADRGIGIAPEHLPYIFDRFYRVDKKNPRGQGRTGLGLAICKAIVNAERGTLKATSTPGIGTTFTVRLPRLRGSN
jgi:two-component system, OmpR family, sensor kinase